MYRNEQREKVYFSRKICAQNFSKYVPEIECNGRVSHSWASKLLLVQANSRYQNGVDILLVMLSLWKNHNFFLMTLLANAEGS